MLSFRNAWTDLPELFFCWLRLWHGVIFGPKKSGSVVWFFRKKPDNCNFHSVSCQIELKFSGKILLVARRTNKKNFPDFTSENPAKSSKNRIKPENHISSYYQHVICHFSWLDHGEVNFDTYFEIFWKKIYQKKIWRIFWINLIFFPNFWHILTFFGVFGCIMIIRISRWNFPNFLSILGDFSTKFKFFWLFLSFFLNFGVFY